MKKKLQTEFSTRQYMISKDFEIYYYSDQGLKKVDSHTHDYYEFYFFLEGNVEIEIEDRCYPLHYGDVVVLPPGIPHRAIINSPGTPYRRFVFWISKSYMHFFLQQSDRYGYLLQQAEKKHYLMSNDRIDANSIHAQIIALIEELHSDHYAREEQISLYVQQLLLHLNRQLYAQKHRQRTKKESSLYQNLLSFIEDHLEEDLSLEAIASHFFVSKYHISHVFKENTGISLHQYVLKKRLAVCKNAMLSDSCVTSFYESYGFQDYSAFYRAFKKEFGISPKEFKNGISPVHKH